MMDGVVASGAGLSSDAAFRAEINFALLPLARKQSVHVILSRRWAVGQWRQLAWAVEGVLC